MRRGLSDPAAQVNSYKSSYSTIHQFIGVHTVPDRSPYPSAVVEALKDPEVLKGAQEQAVSRLMQTLQRAAPDIQEVIALDNETPFSEALSTVLKRMQDHEREKTLKETSGKPAQSPGNGRGS